MRKKTLLLLIPLFAISCSKESAKLGEIELLLSKRYAKLHSCNSPDCERINKTKDTILVLNGEGNYQVIPKSEYMGDYSYQVPTSDVLDIRIKQDTIFLEYLMPDMYLTGDVFWVYDKENNRGQFWVTDPGIIGGL